MGPILTGADLQPYHRWLGLLGTTLLALPACSRGVRADVVGQMVPADCSAPENSFEALWCNSTPPDRVTELPVIQAAVARMVGQKSSDARSWRLVGRREGLR